MSPSLELLNEVTGVGEPRDQPCSNSAWSFLPTGGLGRLIHMNSNPVWMSHLPVGLPHKNGDRVYGTTSGYAADLMAAGTPTVSSLFRKSITPAVGSIDIGDRLFVTFDGSYWWVSNGEAVVGRLTWTASSRDRPDPRTGLLPPLPDSGRLIVERVFINNGEVVNLGGKVLPA